MKISLPQLQVHLTKALREFYFICSDDVLLTGEASEDIRKVAYAQGFLERVSETIESNADFEKILYADTHSLSLFENKKIIELNFHAITFKASYGKILETYLKKPIENILLIIRTNKLDTAMEKSAWYKTMESLGVVIPIWPILAEQLPAWIIERAKKNGLKITTDAAHALARLVEGNLFAASQEIEKLGLLAANGVIDETMIENIATDNAQYDIFHFVDSAFSGNKTRALHILKNLSANTESTLVLWAITRELRTIATIFAETKKGEAINFGKLRVFGKRKIAINAFIERHPKQSCWNFLMQGSSIDRMIKGMEMGNAWEALEDLSIKIAENGIINYA